MKKPAWDFEMLLIEWLGVDSMVETNEPGEFGTILEIIGDVKLGDLGRCAVQELLLHIYHNDECAKLLAFREMPDHVHCELRRMVPGMQSKFATALWKCSVMPTRDKEAWLREMFPRSVWPRATADSTPLEVLHCHLQRVVDGNAACDPLYDEHTLIAFAQQYRPPIGRTKLRRRFRTSLVAAKCKLEEELKAA